jgi:hypothetical protein
MGSVEASSIGPAGVPIANPRSTVSVGVMQSRSSSMRDGASVIRALALCLRHSDASKMY